MKKVFLKYNPYKLETEITVDGKPLAGNSRIGELIKSKDREGNDPRLQDWIEDFPALLVQEYNDRDFEILFHGTLLDYEDVTGAFTDAYHKGLLTAKPERKPAKEISDKEGRIAEVFKEITSENCPFPKLKDAQIKDAFEKAMSDEFEVCVVATMSAGKSTLINAMLGQKLMPSKQEACTAIITKIKDADHNDFCAEVYGKDGSLLETHKKLDYDTMSRLNDDERVSEIRVEGRIPFLAENDVSQDKETSLVLIDTPGPNNARNPEHREIQRNMLDKSSKALVLYVMTGEFGTDDDFRVLDQVAKSMDVRGKQSKDRFIFVVNKLDDRKKEDGETRDTLDRVRVYLKGHGISNPNLFPAAALPALNIHLMNNPNFEMNEDDQDETNLKIRKLNRNEKLHFEEMAPLPPSVLGKINSRLVATQKAWTGRENENPEEALIHSGVVSIEAAIRQYVQKYARTAKIKNIVDTFIHRVTELGCEEEAVLAINKSEEERKRILEHLDRLVEIFSVCWPMYAAMPAVLKEAMEKAYFATGWNLTTSVNPKGEVFPNFADLLEQIENVIDSSRYSADTKGDYVGALCTRVRSLTNGLNGLIFCNDDLTDDVLFDQNVVVDLSRIGSVETKSLIMGLLVMKLNEYRMTSGKINSALSHVTVLEEAHNLLKHTSTEQSNESSNLLGKSVELLSNSIAEMRTYGEGFIIADQSPGLLDMSVIRNTNTKIILRLPEQSDRELVGLSAGLNHDQIQELAKLERGVAAIYQNDWVEPILVKINKCGIRETPYAAFKQPQTADKNQMQRQIINFLIQGRIALPLEFDVIMIEKNLSALNLPTRYQEFLEDQIEEYQTKGTLALWRDENFRKLSHWLTGLLNIRSKVERCIIKSRSNYELTEKLTSLIQETVPLVEKHTILTLCHCVLRDMAAAQDHTEIRKKIYRSWYESAVEEGRKV